MKIKSKICALTLALALGSGLLACNSGGGSTPTPPEPTKYLVNVPTSADYTIAGIDREGYVKDAKVSFTVTLVNQDKEITAVGYDTTTLTATATGSYEFNMPEKNVTLFVSTKDVEKYSLTHTGTIQVDGDPVQFTLKLGTDPVSEDYELVAVEGSEHVSISGTTVSGISAGDAVIAAKINNEEKARESITVERSAYYTLREAIDDAWVTKDEFNDNAKNTKTEKSYKVRAKVVFMGSVYNNKVEMLIDDGTAIIDYQIKASEPITSIKVGDVIEIEEPLSNYYGLIEMYSSDAKYAKVIDYAITPTAFTTIADGEAYDAIYNANMINNGEHKPQAVILTAKGKTVGEGTDAKQRYEVPGATKGLLATTKSVIDLAFVEGASYTFKGYLLNWNDSASAQYCNFIALEQNKMAATSVKIDTEDFELPINTTKQLEYTIQPAGAGQSIKWSSAPEGIVEIDENGLVTASSEGEATITLTVDGLTDTVKATVVTPIPATSASFSKTSEEISTAETLDLNELLSSLPEGNSDDAKKTWSVSPEGVVTVDKGVVTPVAAGTAVVTAKFNESVSASITITVKQQKLADLAHAKYGDKVDVYAYVANTYSNATAKGFWIGDGEYGVMVNKVPATGVVKDAIVHVKGTIDSYNGGKQLKEDATVEVVESYEGLTNPVTLVLNETALAGIDETYQGRFVSLTGVVTEHSGVGQGTNAHHTLKVAIGEKTIKVYVHKSNCSSAVVTKFDEATVGKEVDVTGYVSAYKSGEKDFTKVGAGDYQLINPTLLEAREPTVTSITIDPKTAEVEQSKKLELTATDNFGAPVTESATWEVLDNSKVSVDKGVVTVAEDAVVGSTATIKATYKGCEDTCVITVKKLVVYNSVAKYTFTNTHNSGAVTNVATIKGWFNKVSGDSDIISSLASPSNVYPGANGGQGDTAYDIDNALKIGKASAGGALTFNLSTNVSKVVITGYAWKNTLNVAINTVKVEKALKDNLISKAAVEAGSVGSFEIIFTASNTLAVSTENTAIVITAIEFFAE